MAAVSNLRLVTLRPWLAKQVWLGAALGRVAAAFDVDLSVVLCGRNDNHAGDFVERLRFSLFAISLGLCRHRDMIVAEVILVEWRPSAERPRLSDVIPKWLLEGNWKHDFSCQPSTMPPIRIVSVSDSIADEMAGAGKRSFFPEWQCKAVGLRRAAGQFLLVTNADTMWSPQIFSFLSAARYLRRDSFYLTHPIEFEGPARILHAQGVPFFQIYDQLFSGKHRWFSFVQRHVDRLSLRFPVVGNGISRFVCEYGHAIAPDFRAEEFQQFWGIYDQLYGIKIGVSDELTEKQGRCEGHFANLFDDQPGDFILAPREAWHKIFGPPMLPEKLFVDIMVVCRLAQYFRQVVLTSPCFYYHQAHANATPKVEAGTHHSELNEHNLWGRCCRPFDKFKSEAHFNESKWGFSDMRISESVVEYHPAGPLAGDYVIRMLV